MKFDGCSRSNEMEGESNGRESTTYQLSDDVAYRPGDNNIVVLIVVQVEVLLHARDESIGDVRRINLTGKETSGDARKERTACSLTHLVNIPSVPKVKSVKSNCE